MNFELTEEQRILKESARDFLTQECPKDAIRKWEAGALGYAPEVWCKMAELGWLGLIFPEEYGGSAGSFMDLIVLLEEMGYNICPGPFFASAVLSGLTLKLSGNKKLQAEFLSSLISGEKIFTLALTEVSAGFGPAAVETRATLVKDEYRLKGTKLFVPYAHAADYFLCAARTKAAKDPRAGISLFLLDAHSPGVEIIPLKTLSREPESAMQLTQARAPKDRLLTAAHRAWPLIEQVLTRAALAEAARMVGGAQAVMDLAGKYAKERIQFDRPIGSFQAVQHHFANMWIDINAARLLVYQAAWSLDQGVEAAKVAAMAKARAGDTFRRVTLLGHQIFGGIGFTMEHDMHLYHRRSTTGDAAFGNADYQRELVARELGL